MKRKTQTGILAASILTAALLSFAMEAKVRLPNMLSDNMVLQSDEDVALWGWTDSGKMVSVETSWGEKATAIPDGSDGRWQTTVRTPQAGYTPLSITFSDGDGQVTVSNILSGEVWVCAGQSNMEMTMNGFEACPTEGYTEALVEAQRMPGIRFVKIPAVASLTPLDDADCRWEVLSMETVGGACAVGYFFARQMSRALDIPIGLVMANKGGSRVESWLERDYLEAHTNEKLEVLAKKKKFNMTDALVWGNGTFNPILNYTIKGILFYQGCSNVKDPGNQYSERLTQLVAQWRRQFGRDDIPFYFVETAPCTWKSVDGTERAFLREQQQRAAAMIPNSAIVCTNDCVLPHEWRQIHPTRKQPVGERLALLALNRDYGKGNIMCESPAFDRMEISNDTCTVFLKNDYGAISRYEDIEGFEVAGNDRIFHKAKAIHNKGKGITITCPEVKEPVAVRYCFRNFMIGNVANRAGLPLFPFRTDEWEPDFE